MGWWDWVGIAGFAIGMVAFLMAIRPFTQMMWGRPRLSFSYDEKLDQNGAVFALMFSMQNKPIRKNDGWRMAALYALGVHRDSALDVVAVLNIQNGNTREKVFGALPEINTYSSQSGQRVSLPPSFVPATFGVAIIATNAGQVKPGFDLSLEQTLPNGLYIASVTVDVEGIRVYADKRSFVVQDTIPFLYWVKDE